MYSIEKCILIIFHSIIRVAQIVGETPTGCLGPHTVKVGILVHVQDKGRFEAQISAEHVVIIQVDFIIVISQECHVELAVELNGIGLIGKIFSVLRTIIIEIDPGAEAESVIGGVINQGKTGEVPALFFLFNNIGRQLLCSKNTGGVKQAQ